MLKAVSSITNAIGALNYKGTWNASTNTPALASGVGTKGDYYVVSVAGTTTLDGISNWGVGDWVAFNGSTWQRVEGGADLNGVNLSVTGTTTLSGLTASTALALDASKNVVSVTNTGTGNNVLATSPTFSGTPKLGTKTVPATITGGLVQLINDCLIFSGDVTIGSPYTQNLQIDITWSNWGANPAIALVEVAIAAREFAGTAGAAFGWLYATNGGGATFSSFVTTGVTATQGTLTASSGGNYTLRLTFDPTSQTDKIGYTIRIPTMSGGTATSVTSIVATLV
jgi:hypothetical protein